MSDHHSGTIETVLHGPGDSVPTLAAAFATLRDDFDAWIEVLEALLPEALGRRMKDDVAAGWRGGHLAAWWVRYAHNYQDLFGYSDESGLQWLIGEITAAEPVEHPDVPVGWRHPVLEVAPDQLDAWLMLPPEWTVDYVILMADVEEALTRLETHYGKIPTWTERNLELRRTGDQDRDALEDLYTALYQNHPELVPLGFRPLERFVETQTNGVGGHHNWGLWRGPELAGHLGWSGMKGGLLGQLHVVLARSFRGKGLFKTALYSIFKSMNDLGFREGSISTRNPAFFRVARRLNLELDVLIVRKDAPAAPIAWGEALDLLP